YRRRPGCRCEAWGGRIVAKSAAENERKPAWRNVDGCSQICEHVALPQTRVLAFRDSTGWVPVVDFLDGLPAKARQKCFARISRLRALGHELRRPEADLLRDRIYELRASYQGVHYRILYFFDGNKAVILSHGLT